jgi:hypothetical protein
MIYPTQEQMDETIKRITNNASLSDMPSDYRVAVFDMLTWALNEEPEMSEETRTRIETGLEQARTGSGRNIGSFAQYAQDEDDAGQD